MLVGIDRFAYSGNGILLRTGSEATRLLSATILRTIDSGRIGLDRLATLGY